MLLTIIYVRYQYVLLPQVHLAWQAFLVFHGKRKGKRIFSCKLSRFWSCFHYQRIHHRWNLCTLRLLNHNNSGWSIPSRGQVPQVACRCSIFSGRPPKFWSCFHFLDTPIGELFALPNRRVKIVAGKCCFAWTNFLWLMTDILGLYQDWRKHFLEVWEVWRNVGSLESTQEAVLSAL